MGSSVTITVHKCNFDRTLLPTSTGLLELAKVIGKTPALRELEEQYQSRATSTREFTLKIAKMWGRVPRCVSERAFNEAEELTHIADCIRLPKAMIHYVVSAKLDELDICDCCEDLPKEIGLL